MNIIATDTFEFKDDKSAKSYVLELLEEAGEFSVRATFGRIGAANPQTVLKLEHGTRAKAQVVYDKCVAERGAHGYARVSS